VNDRTDREEDSLVLCRPGGDLLSQVSRHSTIGAEAFDGRVRDGIGSDRSAWATRPAKGKDEANCVWRIGIGRIGKSATAERLPPTLRGLSVARHLGWAWINENDQADRAISTGKLHALLRFHIRPIDVVVFHGSRGRTRFEVGFPLRCIQRLSRPYIATLHRCWRNDRSTRGMFIPVLSY
jgi:hypothetical protein